MNIRIVAAIIVTALTAGCSASQATLTKTAEWKAREGREVQVLLDAKPATPFRVVAELSADTIESPRSIALMREEAARQGLDGIYWIECADRRGVCRAKGFVYSAFDTASASESNSLR